MIKSIATLVTWIVGWTVLLLNSGPSTTAPIAMIEVAGSFLIGLWIGSEIVDRSIRNGRL